MAKPEKHNLKPEVAAKYDCNENYLYGGKLVFPRIKVHGVQSKPAHELTVEEVDKLMDNKAVNGIFSLKAKPAAAAKTEPK